MAKHTKQTKLDSDYMMARIKFLEEERRLIQSALEMALSMGDFHRVNENHDPCELLHYAQKQIKRIIQFESTAIYLLSKDRSDFVLSVCQPENAKPIFNNEIEFAIEKGFLGWTVREKKGILIASKDQSRNLMLHAIATHSDVVGLFAGILTPQKSKIAPTSSTLLSIILLHTANALESQKLLHLLQNRKERLEKKVTQRTKQLLRTERKIQHLQKIEALGVLAGGVAHDLNNILSGIVSYPELLLLNLPQDSPLVKPLETIKRSGDKASAIVQDLLTIARRGVAINEIIDFNTVICDYLISPEYDRLKSFHPYVFTKTNLEKNLHNISGSHFHLAQTIMNLVSNAAEAMPSGGIITISTRNQIIDATFNATKNVKAGDYIVVTVTDSGSGISPEEIDRIFEPFFTKKVMGRSGTGLGMSVVWGTVDDHNGFIEVQSVEGQGTTFRLYFPATRLVQPPPEALTPLKDYMGRKESILVIDDDKIQCEIASGILTKLDYTVQTIPSGEDAITYLQNNDVDLLLIDMIMVPGIDGLETYKRILSQKPGQKAIIVSGFSDTVRVEKALKLGASEYIKKPYTIEKIGMAIKKALSDPVDVK